jgi:hypothetical protein
MNAITPNEQELARQAREAFYSKHKPECNCAAEAAEEIIYLRADDLVFQWEMDDPRDRWKHAGEPQPTPVAEPKRTATYETPQSTIDAFWHVVGMKDPDKLVAWLNDHPRDKEFLSKLLEGASCR